MLTCAALAQTEVYSNGDYRSHPDGGPFNAPRSQVQLLTGPMLNLVSVGVSGGGWVITDNFAVGAGAMLIDEIEVFGYASPMGSPPTLLAEFELSVWDGNPSTGTPNQLIVGAGIGANLIGATGFAVVSNATGEYRVSDAQPLTVQHPIEAIRVTLPNTLVLQPGNYWFGWRAKTAVGTGSFAAIPLTTINVGPTGDALHLTNYWSHVLSGSIFGPNQFPQGFPFKFYGTPTHALGTISNVGGGCSTANLTVAGAPVPGGYVHAEVDSAPGITAIAFPSTPPTVMLPGCSCTVGSSLLALHLGDTVTFALPLDGALYGASIFVQGVSIDPAAACSLPGLLTLDVTDAFEVRL